MPPGAPLVGCACDLCEHRRAAEAGGAAAAARLDLRADLCLPAKVDLRADALLLLRAADEVHASPLTLTLTLTLTLSLSLSRTCCGAVP